MEKLPVFVYGTLRSEQPNFVYYLQGKVTAVQPAYLKGGVLYNFGPFPGLVVTGEANQQVLGDLMFLDQTRYDEIMADLDYLEDCKNQVYARQEIEVQATQAATTVRAWVYVVGPALLDECSDLIESGDWLTQV